MQPTLDAIARAVWYVFMLQGNTWDVKEMILHIATRSWADRQKMPDTCILTDNAGLYCGAMQHGSKM